MLICIANGRILDPIAGIDEVNNLWIEEDTIVQIGGERGQADRTLDATGMVVIPGLIDPHVHLRDPGFTHKEDILTGCEAAAAGGFTAVACMPNTNPPIDNLETIQYILEKAKKAKAKVYPIACITQGAKGEQLCDYTALKQAGAVGISDDGRPVENAAILQQAMVQAFAIGLPVISHCEDMNIIGKGIMHKGKISHQLGVAGMDRTSEDSITAREMALAAATETSIHIAHVSTEGSVAIIRDAKARGVKITGETAPHYLIFTHEELKKQDARWRMNPPLREEKDRVAILQAIKDGTLDMLATDHAPHTKEEKSDFVTAPNGIIGLETAFGAAYTALVKEGYITLGRLVELMSCNPAKLLGISGGTLCCGAKADVAIIQEIPWTVTLQSLHSKSQNTPFLGRELWGKVQYTLCNGNITYQGE